MPATATAVPSEAEDQLLSPRQLCKVAGTSDWFIRQLIAQGKLSIVRLSSRCIRVRASEWSRYLREHSESGPRTPTPRSVPVRPRTGKRRAH